MFFYEAESEVEVGHRPGSGICIGTVQSFPELKNLEPGPPGPEHFCNWSCSGQDIVLSVRAEVGLLLGSRAEVGPLILHRSRKYFVALILRSKIVQRA